VIGNNAGMSTQSHPDDPGTEASTDLDRLEAALERADPAEAPDTADAIADELSTLLDATADERDEGSP
jgi:hypothetical protein